MAKARSKTQETPEQSQTTGNLTVDLGIPELVEFENLGYLPSRPEVNLSRDARAAVKRLAVTLDQREAKLNDGSEIRGSVPKTISWLCERFAESVGSK